MPKLSKTMKMWREIRICLLTLNFSPLFRAIFRKLKCVNHSQKSLRTSPIKAIILLIIRILLKATHTQLEVTRAQWPINWIKRWWDNPHLLPTYKECKLFDSAAINLDKTKIRHKGSRKSLWKKSKRAVHKLKLHFVS